MRPIKIIHAALFATASALATSAAQAQTAPDTAPAPTAAPGAQSADTIVVTGRRFSGTARLQQKNAINLVDVQSAEDIAKYPDFNAAEALSRVAGVSVSSDTGEGRFINIRGIDGNLNGTRFGGVQLLNTQPGGTSFGGGGRAVELDTIPIGAVDQLIVRKTGLPDQEAEGLGGSVDIIPRTAQGIKRPFVDGEIGGGYQPLHGHAGVYRAVLAAGTRFGPDKAFGIELNGSYHEDGRGFDDVEPGYLDADTPSPTSKTLSSVDLRRYNYNRRRFGFGAELTYDPTPQSHYYVRADDAGYTERVDRQVLTYNNLGTNLPLLANGKTDPTSVALVADGNGTIVAPFAVPVLSRRDEQETHLNFVSAIGGHNEFEKFTIDYQGSYTAATYHKDYDYNSTFSSSAGPIPITYNNYTITGLPAINTNGYNPADPTQFTLGRPDGRAPFSNQTEGAHDKEWAGHVEITVPVKLIGEQEAIEFGAKVRFRDKRDTAYNFDYTNNGANPIPPTSLTQVLGPGPYTNFYSGQYNIGYAPNYLALRALIPHNTAFPPLITPNIYFNDTENIYAGFFQYSATFGKLDILAGVRVENTDGTYRSPDLGGATDANGNPLILAGKSNYTNVFPTFQAKYSFNDRLIGRFNYSTGIGRPGFEQLQNGVSPDFGGPAVTVGSPGLKPTTDNAFDLSLQYYLPHAGIISVTLFDKEFDNYIITTLVTESGSQVNAQFGFTGSSSFAPGALVRVSGFNNVKSSYARGIEAEYEQKLTFLPKPFDGFGVSGNVTLVDSSILLHTSANSTVPDIRGPLPGTSTLTWNLAGFYEAHGVQVRLAADWVSPSIFGVGGSKETDYFQDSKFQVDLTSSLTVSKAIQVYFNAKNLFNGPLRYYEGFSNRPGQREFYDQSYEAGVRFHF